MLRRLSLGATLALLISFAALLSGHQTLGSPTASPVASPIVSHDVVLYEANADGGFAAWELSDGWFVYEGVLFNDGSGGAVTVPFVPSDRSYALELEVQAPQPGEDLILTFLGGRLAYHLETDGYEFDNWRVEIDGQRIMGGSRAGLIDANWATLRVELVDNQLTVIINGRERFSLRDNRLLSAPDLTIGIETQRSTQVTIRALRVIDIR